MPIINITLSTRPDAARSKRIAYEVTELTQRHLRKDPTVTAVSIAHIEPEHWFAGGPSLADQHRESFWLDIKVVDGTNTKDELAAYIAAIYEGVGNILGELHPESYAFVHEVSAAAYGFGGRTQEYRYIKGRLAAV